MEKQKTTINEALKQIKKNKKRNFDETVEVHVRLGIDPTKSDQTISTYVVLPKQTKLIKKIVVITNKPESEFKFTSKPYKIGGEEVVKEIIAKNDFKFNYMIAEPDMMKILGKYGKQLGTKGLLPSPKKGTVSNDLGPLYNNLVSQQIFLKNDKNAIVHFVIGKLSCNDEDLITNYDTAILQLKRNKKPSVKGDFIKTIFLSTSMGNSYKLL